MAGGGERRRRMQREEHSTSDEDSDITDVRFMCTWVVYYWHFASSYVEYMISIIYPSKCFLLFRTKN